MKRVALFGLVLFVLAVTFGCWTWMTADGIQRASLITSYKLQTYSFQSEESIIKWIERYHGEASSHQVLADFIRWGISHPEQFMSLLEKLDETTIRRLSFAVHDTGSAQEFVEAFGNIKSKRILNIIANVRKYSEKNAANKALQSTAFGGA